MLSIPVLSEEYTYISQERVPVTFELLGLYMLSCPPEEINGCADGIEGTCQKIVQFAKQSFENPSLSLDIFRDQLLSLAACETGMSMAMRDFASSVSQNRQIGKIVSSYKQP